MTPPGHLSCSACRLRLRADSPAITILEGRCPICGATLSAAASASEVLGFRSFELGALLPRGRDQPPAPSIDQAQLTARREAARAQDTQDAQRWADDGGLALGATVTIGG